MDTREDGHDSSSVCTARKRGGGPGGLSGRGGTFPESEMSGTPAEREDNSERGKIRRKGKEVRQ